jgi:hypothetical protein
MDKPWKELNTYLFKLMGFQTLKWKEKRKRKAKITRSSKIVGSAIKKLANHHTNCRVRPRE